MKDARSDLRGGKYRKVSTYPTKRFNSRIIWQHNGVLRLLVEVTINIGFGKQVVMHEGLNGNALSPTGLKFMDLPSS